MPDKKCEKFSDHDFEQVSEINLGFTNPMDEDPVYEITRECTRCGMIDVYHDV
jgi:hypothetical protein